jgi:hypothetical protein
MSKDTLEKADVRFTERVKAAAGAVKQARESGGLEHVVVRDGARGYTVAADQADRKSVQTGK